MVLIEMLLKVTDYSNVKSYLIGQGYEELLSVIFLILTAFSVLFIYLTWKIIKKLWKGVVKYVRGFSA